MASSVLVLTAPSEATALTEADSEALSLGRAIAHALGGSLDCAVFSAADSVVREAGERGADRVLIASVPLLSLADSDSVLAAAMAAVGVSLPSVVVIARSQLVPELAPRLAARVQGGLVIGAIECAPEPDGALRIVAPAFGGSIRATYRIAAGSMQLVVPAPKASPPDVREPGRVAQLLTFSVAHATSRVEIVDQPEASGPRLEDARIVVSGGRGLGNGANYSLVRQLAQALGGMAGASRAIVDLGWASPAQQVGLTGKIVAPDLYIAAGISGASQHMMGCSNARTIVAINTDPAAPIFKYAHYGIVGDALTLLPELIRLSENAAV